MADEEREPTEDELVAAMRPNAREFWHRTDLTPQQRAQMLQGARRLWKAAHRPTPKATDDVIKREDGHTDKQAREHFEGSYTPLLSSQSSPFIQPSTVRVIWTFLRRYAVVGGVFLLGACWTMIQIDEYALAGILLIIGMAAFAMQVYDWKGITDNPKATRILKGFAYVLSAGCLLFFGAVIVKKKGSKPWSNLLAKTEASVAAPSQPAASPSPGLTALPQITPSPFQIVSPAISSPKPTSSVLPSPRATLKVAETPKPESKDVDSLPSSRGYDGTLLIKGGSPHKLDDLLRAKGYTGPSLLRTVEFNTPNDATDELYWSSPLWNLSAARHIGPGDDYNVPGGTDAATFWFYCKKDVVIGIHASK